MSRKVLFIQTAFLGDVILATSAMETWHEAHPQDRIHLLVRKPMDTLFEGHPWLDNLLAWDKRPRVKGKDWRRLVRMVRKERYDVVVNLHRHASSGILTALSMANVRIGYANNPLAWRFTHRMPHRWGDGMHEVERHRSLLAPFVPEGQVTSEPRLYPGEAHVTEAEKAGARGVMLVMPGSQWATKAWPEGQFGKLLDDVDEPVLLMGAPGERLLCDRLAEGRPHVSNAAGDLSLLGLVAAVQMAKVVVANDSAPLHVATATNTPTVALFTSTVPRFGFGPRSAKHVVVEAMTELPCRPCGKHGRRRCPEGHFKCGWELSVQSVLEALFAVQKMR
ncbi:glycosyltransferase family 9 protein [Flavobacteriales bacterium]|nr:glycosyltransferase family 9 protein [Flavobacteriales bacterium]